MSPRAAIIVSSSAGLAPTPRDARPFSFGVTDMWVPKWQRDQSKGVDSPVPTQVVSNEEFIPRPQNQQQKQVEYLIGAMAETNSKRLGIDRRSFLASSMGLATAFLAMNQVYGPHWEVHADETL